LLDDPALETRGQAAVSLSHLGEARAAPVLRELVDPASYERARAADARKFAAPQHVRDSRVKALEALARLALEQDRALFERLANAEADSIVREAALRALSTR